MSRYVHLSIFEEEKIDKAMSALASPVRRSILRLITEGSFSISEIAKRLGIPISNAVFHTKILQEAGLIQTQDKPAAHGVTKIISQRVNAINIQCAMPPEKRGISEHKFSVPIGSYTDFKVEPSCGMASAEKQLATTDVPGIFYGPDRSTAQLIWFSKGYLEYRIPNFYLKMSKCVELTFSMELCSEIACYRSNWPSDITFWANGTELCTWRCPGDFGDRRGKLNPAWWADTSTQYGLLKTIRVNEKGVYLDESKMSSLQISQLQLEDGDYFTLRIGNKADAECMGGVNLFGEKFGDYEQAIEITVSYQEAARVKAENEKM